MWNTVLPPGSSLLRKTKDHCRAPTWHIRWVSKEGYGIPGFCIRCGANSKSGISGKGVPALLVCCRSNSADNRGQFTKGYVPHELVYGRQINSQPGSGRQERPSGDPALSRFSYIGLSPDSPFPVPSSPQFPGPVHVPGRPVFHRHRNPPRSLHRLRTLH